ncbi:hypothetical protein MYCTH_2311426 [Thermothelomyces thermophilus ATCC 42464]|uniref:Protamine P1 n=1 Tax=Thermothelomyces thermophilus (strain ATCC 42464 / BCRC 31852 / DSM 1799) TaxID=573729 RepID=G2QP50_THET4|nr:uncharacterized protein MYCTH_2311426 [Thermothelomyces thermophilus ATCC 42464]AEO61363.1 hypothetical protein MYCTH_2311426 [Thermothelomyces thermophilus ATCC 42464]
MKRRFGFGIADLEWLHPDNFGNEPICCEALTNPDEVLCYGSDDEAYDSPAERRIRYEAQAERFLEGKPVFLLSASLRGPFDKASGWTNPWRSKSGTREKYNQRKPSSAPRRAAEEGECKAVLDSSNSRREASETKPTLPQHVYTPPRYMDEDTFHRVQSWRDKVIVESDLPPSSIQHSPQPEPTSAESRRATQHTNRRQSGLTLDTLDDGASELMSHTPRVYNNLEQDRSSETSRRKGTRAVACKPGQDLGLNRPRSGLPPSSTHLLERTDPLPHAAQHDEQLGRAARSNRTSAGGRDAPDTTAPTPQTRATSPTTDTPAASAPLGVGNATPSGALPERAASFVLPQVQATPRTDGSFRYRTKDARGKESSLDRSKLANASSAPNSPAQRQGSDGQTFPKRATGAGGDHSLHSAESGGDVPGNVETPKGAGVVQNREAATEVAEHGISGEGHEVEASVNVAHPPHEEGNEDGQGQAEDKDSAKTPSQIDGPTLVPSESLSGSEYDGGPSFGHFSAEKQSQDVISEVFGSSRRLLWPKTQRSTGGDSPRMLGIGSPRPQESMHSRHSSDCRRSMSVSSAALPQETVYLPHEDKTVHAAAEDCGSFIKTEPHSNGEVAADEVDPAVGTAKAQAENEVDDDAMSVTEQLQAGAQTGFSCESSSANHLQPTSSCPAPEIQSPWASDGPAPCLKSQGFQPQHEGGNKAADIRVTPPRTVQSPWCKTEDVVPGALDIPAPPPHLDLANTRLSSIASQALEQAVSQSPWVRGDSQMQLPEVRLFNPLSSPASSHVSPPADPLQDSVIPYNINNDDADMCSPPPYPPQPSTPETKQSGLPSPDFTLSVKSFRDFMTPSPAKRRRISAVTNEEHLPSTQALVEAAISNPWTRESTAKAKQPNFKPRRSQKQQQQARPPKRVSWAPLPGESTPDDANMTSSSPHGAGQPLHTQEPSTPRSPSLGKGRTKDGLARPFRATSPPPSILSTSALPTASQKFGKHFAAVAAASSRRGDVGMGMGVGVSVPTPRTSQRTQASRTVEKSLLPSASQQVCGSPAVEAMAEAFLRAEVGIQPHAGATAPDAADVTAPSAVGHVMGREGEGEGEGTEPIEMDGVVHGECGEGGGEEGEMGASGDEGNLEEEEAPGFADEESPVDEVSAVMDNLDEFLGGNWDLEADLAKVRAEQARNGREYEDGMSRGAAGLSGLMAVNVWD